jgi:PAS domain S-box-containing protein
MGISEIDARAVVRCLLPVEFRRPEVLTTEICNTLGETGCSLAAPVDGRLHFKAMLGQLSAAFVNLAPAEVDAQIKSALKQIVEFLGIDRSGLGELIADQKLLVITHSYEVPGIPPLPRAIIEELMPWFTKQIHRGEVLRWCRLPDDLPPEATHERDYCIRSGLKSNLTIPLRVMGAVVGAIGFGSFRTYRDWPDELVQRLRLVGEIFTNALARKRANIANRESEDRFRVLADTAPVMVWMSGPDKLCTYFNKPWLDFTGRPLEQQLGDSWSEGVHPDDLQSCLQTYGRAFDERQEFRMEYRLQRFDGEYRWVLDTGIPRFRSDGAFEGYIGSCIDITDQKQVEETLRAREQSLRQTREGLRKLAGKLLHAQEEERRRIGREMHDDWTQRLAVLSIDLAKLEKQLGAPQAARPLLHLMQEQLAKLSEDVHALSRQLHPSILDDLGLVDALRSECASFSRRERITVDYRPETMPTSIPKDIALCIYRVAQEALRNIAKHAGVKKAWVALGGTPQEIFLRVQDKGAGFDPAGQRSHPGLGLSSMEERARLIHAEVSVTSAPGQGTTIALHIPLSRRGP